MKKQCNGPTKNHYTEVIMRVCGDLMDYLTLNCYQKNINWMGTDGRLQKPMFTTAKSIHLCFANNLSFTWSLQETVEKMVETAADLKRSHKLTAITSRYFQTAWVFLPKFTETVKQEHLSQDISNPT